MMDLMNVLVQWAPVQCPMSPIMPGVLEDEKDRDLICHGEERWKWNTSGNAEVLRHRVEQPAKLSVDVI